ncbi:transcriptional regulator with XRE-family HTH domain [Mesorhizobium sp. YL-MeA3-2017]|uniref:helix-turn-helix domain-containing protein n=1 Tax=Mesorhizobium sp. YL-MeA3-2017 TaxID=3042284 RepID=UPI0027897068|nr:helix-turn-helix transcriptional regulator [Mesorhizobium sp. YL-MeA3-2017]MDQ0332923.1 transcriptional regulator with XRE-family HTH domain [Mesorhizobium sp. YL-MeA3-2017]
MVLISQWKRPTGAKTRVTATCFCRQQERAEAVAMAIKDVQTYIEENRLVETTDEESEKPIYRKPGFEGIRSFGEMEQIFSQFIREHRDAKRLNRAQVGMMVGLHETIFARYERAFSKLQVTRLIHLCEILDCSPVEMIHAAAPHFFGESRKEADDKLNLMLRILDMPASTASSLLSMIEGLVGDRDPSKE